MTDQNLPESGSDRGLPEYGAYRQQGVQDEEDSSALSRQEQAPQGYASPAPSSGAPYHPYGKPQDGPAPYAQQSGQGAGSGGPQQPYGSEPTNLSQPQGVAGGPTGYPQSPQLPGRGWPITLTIVGAVLAFLIAPIVFAATLFSQFAATFEERDFGDLAKMADSGHIVGGEQKFGADESALIVVKPKDVQWKCTLTAADGTKVTAQNAPDSVSQQQEAFLAQAKIQKEGTYTTTCVGPNNQQPSDMAVLPGSLVSDIFGATVPALMWSTIIGIVGLVMMIVGIVWLVKRNRDRKRIMRSYTLY